MEQKYRITTTPFADGMIEQEEFSEWTDLRESIVRQILDTKEQQIRQSLIALGWTPPVSKT